MNRIETRIIMMVTNRLQAAKDSEAKMELIEELSENLYQRYLELTGDGVAEEEALSQAMENLGDVNELLAYLEAEAGETQAQEGKNSESGRQGGFSAGSFESGLEDMINMAMSTVKAAVDCGKDVARDVSEQIKEKYPDGIFSFTFEKGERMDATSTIPSDGIHSLEVRLMNGDVNVNLLYEAEEEIEITGDTEAIMIVRREDGVLSVKQGDTASSSFLFNRGVRASDIDIRLPRRPWNNISITTVNGDITIGEGLECNGLAVQTTNGDLDIDGTTSGRMALKVASGDVDGRNLNGDVYVETKSGDVELSGRLGRCGISTASGDVAFRGECREANCSSISGDIELTPYRLPEKIKASTKSGDCDIHVPMGCEGFRLLYRTVSGEFSTNLPMTLVGTQKGKSGEAVYQDGGSCEIQLSSISGDLEVRG